jgi:FixJ family two-component response regulator
MSQDESTIAIIDDDESVRNALRRLLRSAGWKAVTFATAEEFLQIPVEPVPLCLILDVHLPGISGLDLKKQLNAAGRNIPVVFITAYDNEQIREQVRQAGALACLCKPFEEQIVLHALALATR